MDKEREAAFREQLEAAQDIVNAALAQRNAALNDVVKLTAQMEGMARKLAKLEAQIKEDAPADSDTAAKLTKLRQKKPVAKPVANGAAAETVA